MSVFLKHYSEVIHSFKKYLLIFAKCQALTKAVIKMEKILTVMKLIPMGDAHAIHTYIIHYQLELYVTEKRKQGTKGRDL